MNIFKRLAWMWQPIINNPKLSVLYVAVIIFLCSVFAGTLWFVSWYNGLERIIGAKIVEEIPVTVNVNENALAGTEVKAAKKLILPAGAYIAIDRGENQNFVVEHERGFGELVNLSRALKFRFPDQGAFELTGNRFSVFQVGKGGEIKIWAQCNDCPNGDYSTGLVKGNDLVKGPIELKLYVLDGKPKDGLPTLVAVRDQDLGPEKPKKSFGIAGFKIDDPIGKVKVLMPGPVKKAVEHLEKYDESKGKAEIDKVRLDLAKELEPQKNYINSLRIKEKELLKKAPDKIKGVFNHLFNQKYGETNMGGDDHD